VLWTDASGKHLLAACRGEGRIDNGHFTSLPWPEFWGDAAGKPFAW